MRILQVVQKPQRRGAETFAYELSKNLIEGGHHVRTVYLYPYSGDKPLPLREGDVVLSGDESHLLEKVPGIHPGLAHSLLKEIERFAPDIVQANGARTVKYGAASKVLAGLKPSWALVYRNIDVPSFWNQKKLSVAAYRHVFMPQMDGVIGVSEYCLKDVLALYKMDVPAQAILNGIDERKLTPSRDRAELRGRFGAQDDDVVLLFLGSLVNQKRPDRFVRVLAHVVEQRPEVRGWVVGDGSLREESEALAVKHGVADRSTFFGYQDRVADFIAAADVFVMTSDTEGVPAVVLEAGYLGLPVVATNVGGMRECVLQGRTGTLVSEPFEDGLTDAITDLVDDPLKRRRMGANGRVWVQENRTMPMTARDYASFYRQVSKGQAA